jgi:Putative Flp pilus-assembly TadE/G-like
MRRYRHISGEKGERGVVILLVALVLLFVVGAMAVLAIDVVTFYTARSEAQLAADSAALAGARVMANSGATSNPPALEMFAQNIARSTAIEVAAQNKVGGRYLNPATEVTVTQSSGVLGYNPRVTVQVTRNDLPTFFARIWGRTQVTVIATATAEAYNPSGANISLGAGGRVAPICVKPWLLPNLDPGGSGQPLFDPSGGIVNNSRVGQDWPVKARCESCTGALPSPVAGQYYPAAIDSAATDPEKFPVPTQSLPACTPTLTADLSQIAVAACVQQPISCGINANYKIDVNPYGGTTRDADTLQAMKCLIHDNGADGDSDSIDSLALPSPPFQFLAGNANPIASAVGHSVVVSNSLVTVPVIKSSGVVGSPVQVVGFLQVFLNPTGGTLTSTPVQARIVNMAGCGETATGQPVLGYGASAVPVRLVSE